MPLPHAMLSYPRAAWQDQDGMITALGLFLLTVLTVLGTTAIMVTSTDMLVGTNYKTSEQAFYAAEAGAEESRGRLRANAGANLINDAHTTAWQWTAYIGTTARATGKGFDSGQSMHLRTESLQSAMSYVVAIRHKSDDAGNVFYWGDAGGTGISTRNLTTGTNIYLATSYGLSARSTRTVEVEMARLPPITVPAGLYTEAPTTIQGSSTNINGNDSCGADNKPGIAITLGPGSVTINGSPSITGTGSTPSITYNTTGLHVQATVDELKSWANYSYNVTSESNSGMHWGTPTQGAEQEDPSSCSETNIVRYDTNGTYISLTGGSSGCGILLVEGNLNLHGGFTWYGPILATGSVTFTGGGNKQVTGAILAGGSVDADVVGGNSNIIFCSVAINNQTQNRPLKVLSWHES